MPNKNLTDIVVVMDRSGSMITCKYDAEKGLNHFIREQQQLPGEANLTLVQFDGIYEVVHAGKRIKEVGYVTLEPRGSTALLDALGKAIIDTGDRLRRLPEYERPGLVVMLVVTDGEENSSREFTIDRVREMIKHQQEKYNWQFVYVGANQDAFKVAGAMNFNPQHTASYDVNRSSQTWASNSGLVGSMRSLASNGGNVSAACYSDEDRQNMVDNSKKTVSSQSSNTVNTP